MMVPGDAPGDVDVSDLNSLEHDVFRKPLRMLRHRRPD
jgi:hypothetical protein